MTVGDEGLYQTYYEGDDVPHEEVKNAPGTHQDGEGDGDQIEHDVTHTHTHDVTRTRDEGD